MYWNRICSVLKTQTCLENILVVSWKIHNVSWNWYMSWKSGMSLEKPVLTYSECVLKHVSWNYVMINGSECLENHKCVLKSSMCLDIKKMFLDTIMCVENMICLLRYMSWYKVSWSWCLEKLLKVSWKCEFYLEIVYVSWNTICLVRYMSWYKVSWAWCLEKFLEVSWNSLCVLT